ncbi:hypothetical protein HHK36_011534 [Tetracentron sinense]|uniref:Protein FAR1-RELATED SEQUENCE n=1 Tax=Tetracentron sinense TaxID=13715 RepID=A0A834ZAI8_TETSI|nr:hypothetical protein HHK36_011534 [Tetracentron sinense]
MMEIDLGLHEDKYDMKDIRLNVDRNTMNDTDEGHDEDEGDVTFSTIEPYLEMDFNSKEEAYSFYREYAKSIGFGTSKLNSRRSRVSGEFIDAKFVCCKYGKASNEAMLKLLIHGLITKQIARQVYETTSTYVWLMRTWLKAMGGKAPKAIVTDQDKAMKAAIAEVFPNSRHRFCLWHIMRKIPEKLGHVTRKYENFMAQLNKCIYKSWTEEQFENRWWKMVETFELGKNGWIKSLYEDRKQWVPTYMRDTFFAGMSTTQRSESINSFFDKYVQRKTTLKEFIEQYKVALQDRHERESKASFDTWNRTPILKSHSPYEKQMSTVYTHEIFKKFQREVLEIVACHPKKEEEDETVTMFMVHDFEANEDFIVEWEEAESKVSCLCRLFEYKGFLCRHAMTILQFSAVSKIPSHYILNRWSNNAKNHNIEAPALEEVKSVMPKLKVLDPQVTKTKGAPKRIKSGIEKKRKKNNTSKKDKENSNSIVSWPSIDGYCTTQQSIQQSIQGQSTSMSLNFDGYVLQQSMQGLLQSMHG